MNARSDRKHGDVRRLVIDGREPSWQRWLLLTFGTAAIVLPAWQLRFAFFEIGWWTVFFGIIVAGAWSVGGSFVLAAVAGQGLHWTFEPGRVELERTNWLGGRREVLASADVARIEIETVTWDNCGDTYRPVVVLQDGERLPLPDKATPEAARELVRQIERLLATA